RRDLVGEQRRHERAAAHPDVEVEVGQAAAEEVVQRAQAPDLVHGPGDAAARADERDLRPRAAAGTPGHAPPRLDHRAYADAAAGPRRRAERFEDERR